MSDLVGRTMESLMGNTSRVVVNKAGGAITSSEMARQCEAAVESGEDEQIMALADVAPCMAFIRDDGWVLFASPKFEQVAYGLWLDKWVGFCRMPDLVVSDIADYVPYESNF